MSVASISRGKPLPLVESRVCQPILSFVLGKGVRELLPTAQGRHSTEGAVSFGGPGGASEGNEWRVSRCLKLDVS